MDASKLKNRKALRKIGDSQFGALLQDPQGWVVKGGDLMTCATTLRKEHWRQRKAFDKWLAAGELEFGRKHGIMIRMAHMEGPISLLLAYAFENHLKAIWIYQNPSSTGKDRKLPKHFRDEGYNLVAHADNLEIFLCPKEREALGILSEFSTWRGRYPIALNSNQNAEAWSKAENLKLVSSKYPGRESWPDEITSLICKLRRMFRVICPY